MLLKLWFKVDKLQSIDPECLSVLTYARITKAPLNIKYCVPHKTVSGLLPELQIEENVHTSTLGILSMLRLNRYNADYTLTPTEHADTLAYTALIEQKLKPAFLYALWVDSANYTAFTRPNYAKAYGFFPSFYYLPRMHNHVERYLDTVIPGEMQEKEKILYQNANECLTLLSKRLGEEKYFFGKSASTLDAIVYGYLAILLNAPILSPIKQHLSACHNLSRFVENISQTFYGSSSMAVKDDTDNKSVLSAKFKLPFNVEQALPIIIGVTAMIAYGMLNGIISKNMFNKKSKRSGNATFSSSDVEDNAFITSDSF